MPNKTCLLFLIMVKFSCLRGQVALYGQCGGIGYSGSVNCISGLSCFVKDAYYSQCLTSCPTGWHCQCNFINYYVNKMLNFI